jgi:transposase|nr:transposase [Neorhizobium tomejilense]
MITGIPELNRYLDDTQWKAVAQAIRASGGKVTDGNRLHVDAVLDLMQNRRPWRDLDYRYGPWPNVYAKFARWFETGILHGLVTALFKLGLTDNWRETYVEISHGPSARTGPQIRPLMAQIANELRRHSSLPKKRGRKTEPKLPQPATNDYRTKKKAYDARVKAAVKARKGLVDGRMSDEEWALIAARIPEFNADNSYRRQVDELCEVMRTNKGWSYMDARVGNWNAAYGRFMKWVTEGTMTRLVRCLHGLGLTKDWSSFLVAPLANGEKSLKRIIGNEAYVNMTGVRKPRAVGKRAAKTPTAEAAKKATAKSKTATASAKKTKNTKSAKPATKGTKAKATSKSTSAIETKREKTSTAKARVKARAVGKARRGAASAKAKSPKPAASKTVKRPRTATLH